MFDFENNDFYTTVPITTQNFLRSILSSGWTKNLVWGNLLIDDKDLLNTSQFIQAEGSDRIQTQSIPLETQRQIYFLL